MLKKIFLHIIAGVLFSSSFLVMFIYVFLTRMPSIESKTFFLEGFIVGQVFGLIASYLFGLSGINKKYVKYSRWYAIVAFFVFSAVINEYSNYMVRGYFIGFMFMSSVGMFLLEFVKKFKK